eukprot:jgi/Tetstr1/429691/TSEL_019587.t1
MWETQNISEVLGPAAQRLRRHIPAERLEAEVHDPRGEVFWAFVGTYEAEKLRLGLRQELDLGGAVLMPLIGVVAIAEALQPVRSKDGSWVHNACVQRLGLNGVHLGEEGAQALSDALRPRMNPDGRATGTELGDAGCCHIAQILEPRQNEDGTWAFNGTLEDLQLECNSIGDDGAQALASALAPRRSYDATWVHHSALRTLSLWGNQVGYAGAKALVRAVRPEHSRDGSVVVNHALWQLDVQCNLGIDDADAVEELRRELQVEAQQAGEDPGWVSAALDRLWTTHRSIASSS